MNKFDASDPNIEKFLADPRIVEFQAKINDFTKAEYAHFNEMDFVGIACDGLIKITYCQNKGGFCKTEIDSLIYNDKTKICESFPIAINDALVKYNTYYKNMNNKILDLENELYIKMVDIAKSYVGLNTEHQDINMCPSQNKKNYLN